MNDDTIDMPFYQLILSLQSAAALHMGKVMSPVSGEIERDLNSAKGTIDLIEMIQRKTAGNLTADEKKFLDHIVFELRLNYVDEIAKDKAPPPENPTLNSSASPADNEEKN